MSDHHTEETKRGRTPIVILKTTVSLLLVYIAAILVAITLIFGLLEVLL